MGPPNPFKDLKKPDGSGNAPSVSGNQQRSSTQQSASASQQSVSRQPFAVSQFAANVLNIPVNSGTAAASSASTPTAQTFPTMPATSSFAFGSTPVFGNAVQAPTSSATRPNPVMDATPLDQVNANTFAPLISSVSAMRINNPFEMANSSGTHNPFAASQFAANVLNVPVNAVAVTSTSSTNTQSSTSVSELPQPAYTLSPIDAATARTFAPIINSVSALSLSADSTHRNRSNAVSMTAVTRPKRSYSDDDDKENEQQPETKKLKGNDFEKAEGYAEMDVVRAKTKADMAKAFAEQFPDAYRTKMLEEQEAAEAMAVDQSEEKADDHDMDGGKLAGKAVKEPNFFTEHLRDDMDSDSSSEMSSDGGISDNDAMDEGDRETEVNDLGEAEGRARVREVSPEWMNDDSSSTRQEVRDCVEEYIKNHEKMKRKDPDALPEYIMDQKLANLVIRSRQFPVIRVGYWLTVGTRGIVRNLRCWLKDEKDIEKGRQEDEDAEDVVPERSRNMKLSMVLSDSNRFGLKFHHPLTLEYDSDERSDDDDYDENDAVSESEDEDEDLSGFVVGDDVDDDMGGLENEVEDEDEEESDVEGSQDEEGEDGESEDGESEDGEADECSSGSAEIEEEEEEREGDTRLSVIDEFKPTVRQYRDDKRNGAPNAIHYSRYPTFPGEIFHQARGMLRLDPILNKSGKKMLLALLERDDHDDLEDFSVGIQAGRTYIDQSNWGPTKRRIGLEELFQNHMQTRWGLHEDATPSWWPRHPKDIEFLFAEDRAMMQQRAVASVRGISDGVFGEAGIALASHVLSWEYDLAKMFLSIIVEGDKKTAKDKSDWLDWMFEKFYKRMIDSHGDGHLKSWKERLEEGIFGCRSKFWLLYKRVFVLTKRGRFISTVKGLEKWKRKYKRQIEKPIDPDDEPDL